jgi:lipoprotein-releasing system permease protein
LNLPFFIARRYLVSKKKQHIINIISIISAVGICVGTFALVIVLSVFNGFDGLIKSYFSMLDPDIKITPKEGKYFDPAEITENVLSGIPGLADFAMVIEDNALLTYNNRQFIATLKGVPKSFSTITGIDTLIVNGRFLLDAEGISFAVPGQGVASFLGVDLNKSEPIHVYVPKKGLKTSFDPNNALNNNNIYPSGIFSLLEEVDSHTVFVPLSFAAGLFESGNKITAIEIKLNPVADAEKIRKSIEKKIGSAYFVQNKYQQHETLYKTMKSEKWITYLILAFILIIASLNILGSLSMLIIDKKEDIQILRSMGAAPQLIRLIFLFEGWLISIIGSVLGLALGILVCWIQIYFKLVTLPGEGSFVISAYPVDLQSQDLLLIFFVVMMIGFLAAWYPVRFVSTGSKNSGIMNHNPQ